MTHHTFKIEKTAHVYTHGACTEGVQYFWFVAHGYGQLASRIIRKFEHFDDAHFVVAPEGLSRFYWKMGSGEVGASWMTKEDRLAEIEDYARYLSHVFDHFRAQLKPDVRVILLGFSQGCATVMRWILRGHPAFNHFVMWGGILPEDIDYQPFKNYFSDKNLHFICGNDDEFVSQDRIDWNLSFAEAQGIPLHYVAFAGKHEILVDVLRAFFQNTVKK